MLGQVRVVHLPKNQLIIVTESKRQLQTSIVTMHSARALTMEIKDATAGPTRLGWRGNGGQTTGHFGPFSKRHSWACALWLYSFGCWSISSCISTTTNQHKLLILKKCASNHLNKMILLRGRGHYKFGRFFDSFAPNKLFAMIFEHVSVPFSHRGKLKITVAALERGHALHILVHLENMLLNVPFGAEHFAANVALKRPLLLMHTLNMFFQAHFIRVLFSALRAHGFDRLMNVS